VGFIIPTYPLKQNFAGLPEGHCRSHPDGLERAEKEDGGNRLARRDGRERASVSYEGFRAQK